MATPHSLDEPGSPEPRRAKVLQARLSTLVSVAFESASLAYRRRLHMPEPVRRILFLIGVHGGVTSRDLVIFSGREKAQISRSVNALHSAGLIERGTLRSPIVLSEAGRRIFSEIMSISTERNELLCEGIPPAEIERFVDLTKGLIDKASSLYEAEGDIPRAVAMPSSAIFHPPRLVDEGGAPTADGLLFSRMILPWLQSLVTYIQRSGAQVFKREIDLSAFELRLLSQIGEHQPTTLSFLIGLVGRDKSQVARTVQQLNRAGLVERLDEGRVNVALSLTGKGQELYARMCRIAIERDEFLLSDLSGDDKAFYVDVVDRLSDNARKLLVAEQTADQSATPEARTRPVLEGLSTPAGGGSASRAQLVQLAGENARLKQLLAEAMLEISRLRGDTGMI